MSTLSSVSPLEIQNLLLSGEQVPQQQQLQPVRLPSITTERSTAPTEADQALAAEDARLTAQEKIDAANKSQQDAIDAQVAQERSQRLKESASRLLDTPLPRRDLSEAATSLATGIVGFGVGAVNAGSKILNAKMQQIAQKGPITASNFSELLKGTNPDTFYRDISKQMTDVAQSLTFEPRTPGAKMLVEAASVIPHGIRAFGDFVGQESQRLGISPDNAELLARGVELATFYALDKGVREALPNARASVAKLRNLVNNAPNDASLGSPEVLQAARAVVEQRPRNEIDAIISRSREQYAKSLDYLNEQNAQLGKGTPETNATLAEIDQVLANTVVTAPGVNPTMLPKLRTLGESILERLKENPDNIQTIADAANFQIRAEQITDPAVTKLSLDISDYVPIRNDATLQPPSTTESIPAPRGLERNPEVQTYLQGRDTVTSADLQRDLGLSRSEAARQIKALEANGQVGAAEAGGARKVITPVAPEEPSGSAAFDILTREPEIDTTPAIRKPRIIEQPKLEELRPTTEPVPPGSTEASTGATETSAGSVPSRLYQPIRIADLGKDADLSIHPEVLHDTPVDTALQLNTVNGAPKNLIVDTRKFTPQESALNTVRANVRKGLLSEEEGATQIAALHQIAADNDISLFRAHLYTAEDFFNDAAKAAIDHNLDLYRVVERDGKEFIQKVSPESASAQAKLAQSPLSEAPPVTPKEAATFATEKSAPVGPDQVQKVAQVVETGELQGSGLDPSLVDAAEQLTQATKRGQGGSERRGVAEIASDISTLLSPSDRPIARGPLGNEQGSISLFGLTRSQRLALQNLKDDILRAEVGASEFFRRLGIDTTTGKIYTRYLESLGSPPPKSFVDLTNLGLDPSTVLDDPIIGQRKVKIGKDYYFKPPVYESEVNMMQQAKEVVPNLRSSFGKYDFNTPYSIMRKAGLSDTLLPAYRSSERAYTAELRVLNNDLLEIAKDLPRESRENVTKYGLGTSEYGQALLARRKTEAPLSLNANEKGYYDAATTLYHNTMERINSVREAIGVDKLEGLDDAFGFMRAFLNGEKLDRGLNLINEPAKNIYRYYKEFMDGPVHADTMASFDASRIVADFQRGALKQYHLGPFIAKLDELVYHALPDPVSGAENWLLKDHKPGLYDYLSRWRNFLVSSVDSSLPPWATRAMNTLMDNLAASTLSLNYRSAAVQFSTMAYTYHALGLKYTTEGIAMAVSDVVRSGLGLETNREFALKNSLVLDSRGLQDAYRDVQAAIVGHNPADFFRAIKEGRIRDTRETIFGAGYKLLELADRESALITWHGAYKLATNKLGYEGQKAFNFADDIVVRTQGGTMPGDVAGIQRHLGGKILTQFQRFLINEFNYLADDVFALRPPDEVTAQLSSKYVPFVVGKSLKLFAAVTAMNILYEDVLKINSPFPSPLRDVKKGIDNNESVLQLAGRLAASPLEQLPVIGASRYGRGFGGPVFETARDITQSLRGDTFAYKPIKPGDSASDVAARLYGSPFARLSPVAPGSAQVGKYLRARDRGEDVYKSLTGFYEEPQTGGGGLKTLRSPASNSLRSLR